jgi:hypothetical protein
MHEYLSGKGSRYFERRQATLPVDHILDIKYLPKYVFIISLSSKLSPAEKYCVKYPLSRRKCNHQNLTN